MRQLFQRRSKDGGNQDGPPRQRAAAVAATLSSKKIFPSGIKLLYKSEDSVVDIIFVHGLTGDREKTWRHKDTTSSWPQSLLPSKIPNVRILTFGYDAYVTDWRGVASQNRIANHAWNLLTALATYREEDNTNERPIIFVCHSLGGLVCEDALVTSGRRLDKHLLNINRLTRGIVFLGTPHHGAGLARWAELLARSIGVIKQANAEILHVLQQDSEVLARIQESFHTMILARNREGLQPIEISCFYEELPLQTVGLVVPQDSAILPGYISIGIRSNHVEIAKCNDVDDPRFLAICGELRRWVKELSSFGRAAMPAPRVGNRERSNEQGSVRFTQEHHWTVPFGRNKNFIGRESVLVQLIEKIHPASNDDDCQRTAIVGLGGVGKTQIALEAVFRLGAEFPECSVFWVPATDVTSFEHAYRDIGRKLRIHGIEEDDADVKSLVQAALGQERSGRWLLVVDNADDMELLFGQSESDHDTITTPRLARCLPFSRKGSILFTSRNHRAAVKLAGKNIMSIPTMSSFEASQLLEANLVEKWTARDTGSTTQLLSLLTNLPLAIRQAAAYMNENQMSTTDYLEIYQSNDDEMVYLLAQEFEDLSRYESMKNPIATTWLISFHQILRFNPLAADYLRLMSFLAGQDILPSLLPLAPKAKTAEAIGTLKAYAFLSEREELHSYDIHQLVQLTVRNWVKQTGEWNLWITKVLRRLADAFPFPKHENRDVWMRYIPHTQCVLEHREHAEDENAVGDLLFHVGEGLYNVGKYDEAEQMHQQALELREKVLGKGHPDTFASMNNLAIVLNDRGNYEGAEHLHRQALELKKKVHGKQHPSTLRSMNNLALVLRSQGKYTEAEQMHRQEWNLTEKVLGKEHPDTLASMNNLAIVLNDQGKDEALALMEQCSQMRGRVLGPDHAHTKCSLSTLNEWKVKE